MFTGFSNLGLKFMGLFLGLMFVWRVWFFMWCFGLLEIEGWVWVCVLLSVIGGGIWVWLCLIVLIWVCCDWFGFDDLWGVEFGLFLLVFIYVLVIWDWVLGLLGLCSCDGFEFLDVGFDLGRIWRTSCKMKNNMKNMKNNLNSREF